MGGGGGGVLRPLTVYCDNSYTVGIRAHSSPSGIWGDALPENFRNLDSLPESVSEAF